MSRNVLEMLKKQSVLLGGLVFSAGVLIMFYVNSYLILLILAAILAFGSSIIDCWNNTYRKGKDIVYIYTGIILIIIFTVFHFTGIKLVDIIMILSAAVILLSLISILFDYQNINYKKTGLTKKIKRYIISISDIRRIRNGWALFYVIIINGLLYMSVAIVLIVFPLLIIQIRDVVVIYEFVGISAISFFTIFLGNRINARIFQGISFISIFPMLMLIGFAISIKNTPSNLTISLLPIPLVTLFVPGYRKYLARKFPRSEIYYVNKFTNFFTGIFIISVPFIVLGLISVPVYVITIELIGSVLALITCLKFTNYPEIVRPKKHKN
jgi:hypothetical protein